MSTPNPLIPQGTFQAAAGKGASNVRIAVATIVAIHVVFFGGLLLQGCKRDNTLAIKSDAETNAATSTNYTLPPINSDSLYSNSTTRLAADSATNCPAPPSGPMSDTLGSSTTSGIHGDRTISVRRAWPPARRIKRLARRRNTVASGGHVIKRSPWPMGPPSRRLRKQTRMSIQPNFVQK